MSDEIGGYQADLTNKNVVHEYIVTLAYHFKDKHNTFNGTGESPFAWAELEDKNIVVYKYKLNARNMQDAITVAIEHDNVRKVETACTWPSMLEAMDLSGKEETQDFYHFLVEKGFIEDWFVLDPTTVSAVMSVNETFIHMEMQNNVLNIAQEGINDLEEFVNKPEEE